MHVWHCRYCSLKAAATELQAAWRAKAARVWCQALRQERRRQLAAAAIQAAWRGHQVGGGLDVEVVYVSRGPQDDRVAIIFPLLEWSLRCVVQ